MWHPVEQRPYRVDVPAGRLYRYDPETGEHAVACETDDVSLGGVTVEAAGSLWSARWDGGRLVRYDPTGRPVREVEFPARTVSSLAFTGPGARNYTPRPR